MSKEQAELLDLLRGLSLRLTTDVVSGVERVKNTRDDLLALAGIEESAGSAKRREDRKSLLYEIAKLEVQLAERLLRLGQNHADTLFDSARDLATRAKNGGAAPARTLRLDRPSKGRLHGDFRLRNTLAGPAHPRFTLSKFVDQSGADAGRLDFHCTAEGDVIASKEESLVQVSIDPALAPRGGVFFGDLDVVLVGDQSEPAMRRTVVVTIQKVEQGGG